ncbi:MAG TPA: FUSC family protein [Myxococcaceae bacterium]|nr:FUSC family protein [Myxococcaceae bacterium]
MTTTAQPLAQQPFAAPREGWWEILRAELTLAPERTARMVRMTVMVMGVVLISMTLRVPEAAISTYMIFFATREDGPGSVKTGIGLIVAVTMAVLAGLAVLCFTEGEPSLRLAAIATLAFGTMYAAHRSPKLGALGFASGFVATMILVYVEIVPSPEALTRAVCWIWVVVAYPFALVVLCESIFGDDPEVLFRRGLSRRLAAVASLLETAPEVAGPARRRVARLEQIGTEELAPHAARGPAALVPLRTSLVGEAQTLLVVASRLAPAPASSSVRAPLCQAAAACVHLSQAILGEKGIELSPPPVPTDEDLGGADAASMAVVLPLLASIRTLAMQVDHLRDPARASLPTPPPAVPPTPAELEEKRVEPVRFAAKVTLAAITAYILYTALDWSGIHTAMITCFFVAQESVGATVHKFTLRLTGAVLGGAVGILSLILVVPRLDSGGGLAVFVGVVTLLAAWFSTASQRISYAGWQFAFAFYLVVLQGFERSTKMMGARDRALGIILGNVLIALIFTHLWPGRVAPRISDGIARALDALADLVSVEVGGPESEVRSAQLEQAFFGGLNKAQQSAFLARFEPGATAGASMLPTLNSLFLPARALSLSASSEARAGQALPDSERWRVQTVATLRHTLALRLRELAGAVREGRTPRIEGGKDAFAGPRRSFAAVSDAGLRKALAPVELRLEWLGMVGEGLESMIEPARTVVALGGVR